MLLGIGALAFAAAAFVLAFGGSGQGVVAVDGGEPLAGGSPGASGLAAGTGDGRPTPSGGIVVVEIVGAVVDPGVFRLPVGSRVGDLLAAAGGYGPRVDTAGAEQQLNLAASLKDGDRVRVPSRDDAPGSTGPAAGGPTASGPAGAGAATGRVDLNRATADQLDALPGVGPVTVQKILDARAEAPFATIDELQTRGIVGAKTLDKLRPLVTAG